MVTKIIRRLWIELLIALDPNFTLEGFKLTGKPFELPPNASDCEARFKQRLTICNLFVNQQQSARTIARVLDVSPGRVITVLIEEGIIAERRRPKTKQVKRERRQSLFAVTRPAAISGNAGITPQAARPVVTHPSRIQTLFAGGTAIGSRAPDSTGSSSAIPPEHGQQGNAFLKKFLKRATSAGR
jgi:hypothetical protein